MIFYLRINKQERPFERGKLVLHSDSLNQEFMSGVPSVYGFDSLEDTID